MSRLFRFKQFAVDQSGCAMKINTDGALLGALACANPAERILDVGTGTGVIALMLAQRFSLAQVDAVEIDEAAASTAAANFRASPFADRLSLYEGSFQDHFLSSRTGHYDLIVSNPPFFLASLKNPDPRKEIARHANLEFFTELVEGASRHLNEHGTLVLILPPETATVLIRIAERSGIYVHHIINIVSFPQHRPHRQLLSLGWGEKDYETSRFAIYKAEKEYSEPYRGALKDFFTIF